jgi:hypothetical protein
VEAVIAKVGADRIGIRLSPYGTFLEVRCSGLSLLALDVTFGKRITTGHSWCPLMQLLQYTKARCQRHRCIQPYIFRGDCRMSWMMTVMS